MPFLEYSTLVCHQELIQQTHLRPQYQRTRPHPTSITKKKKSSHSTELDRKVQSWMFVNVFLVLTVEPDDHTDYVRIRQHISTIETTSPSRSLLQQGLQGGPGATSTYAGYCTLRNGMPLQDLNNIGSKPKMVRIYCQTSCIGLCNCYCLTSHL